MQDGEELWVCDELDGRRLQEQGDLLVADRGGRALSPGLWVTGQDRAMEITPGDTDTQGPPPGSNPPCP